MDDAGQDRVGHDGAPTGPSGRRPEAARTFQPDDVGAAVGAEELDEKAVDETPLAFPTSDAPGG